MNPWLYVVFFLGGITVLYLLADLLTRIFARPAPTHCCSTCGRSYGDTTVACCAMCADEPWWAP